MPTFEQVAGRLQALNDDPAVSGVLLQLPLPDHLDGPTLTGLIDPGKDVDGLTPVNAGLLSLGRPGLRPCTPSGVIELLASVRRTARRRRGGRRGPLEPVRQADGAAAAGGERDRHDLPFAHARPARGVRTRGHPDRGRRQGKNRQARLRQAGAIVIDVGMNRLSPEQAGTKSGLVGDVDFAPVSEVASAITPVPGGVGPMTIAMLLSNTLQAAARAARDRGRTDGFVGGEEHAGARARMRAGIVRAASLRPCGRDLGDRRAHTPLV